MGWCILHPKLDVESADGPALDTEGRSGIKTMHQGLVLELVLRS